MNVVKGLTLAAAAVAGIAGAGYIRATSLKAAPAAAPVTVHSALPSAADAKMLLNMTTRHREWIVVPISKETSVLAWVVYPERSDRAQVVMMRGETLEPSDWTRAVSDQLSAEGYLTVVPDVLTEVDSHGNRRSRGSPGYRRGRTPRGGHPSSGAAAPGCRPRARDRRARRLAEPAPDPHEAGTHLVCPVDGDVADRGRLLERAHGE